MVTFCVALQLECVVEFKFFAYITKSVLGTDIAVAAVVVHDKSSFSRGVRKIDARVGSSVFSFF